MTAVTLVARLILAAVFAVAGVAKLADPAGSRRALEGFGVPRAVVPVGGVALPAVELTIAAALLIPATTWLGAIAAFALLCLFTTAIGLNLARGKKLDCHCFGQVHSAPVGWHSLLRNLALLAVSVVIVTAGQERMQSPVSWVGGLSAADLILVIVAMALAIAVVAEAFILLQLIRQNGRILSRLDSLERHGPSALAQPQLRPRTSNSQSPGLPVGAAAPEFELSTPDGDAISLESLRLRGLPVLLIFSDPDCAPCSTVLPDVGAWQRNDAVQFTIALVSRGSVEENVAVAEENGLADVILQRDQETAAAYRSDVTPSAVLVSVDGRIASQIALGPSAIRALVDDSRAEPEFDSIAPGDSALGAKPSSVRGFPVGAEAPDLELEDIDRQAISMRNLRGAPVTLIFWNSSCGFCQQLAPGLKAWQESHASGEHRLIVMSSDAEYDSQPHDLGVPIVIDDDFRLGTLFGVGGTPSAVAIDADGRIASPPAVGGSALLQMLGRQYGAMVGV